MTELSIKLLRIVGLFCEIRHYYILIDRVSSTLLILLRAFILQKSIIKCMTFYDIMVPSPPLFQQLEFLRLNDIINLQIVFFS